MPISRMEGRTAVVSGAASGIGQAVAVRLAAEGGHVVLVDLQPAEATRATIAAAGGSATMVQCDVSSPESVDRLRASVEAERGHADILVNVAGIYPDSSFDALTFDLWKRVMSVNLDSAFLMAKAFVPGMQRQKWGRIVNFTSATISVATSHLVHYIASKGGVTGLTRALATDLGDYDITVNAVAPGMVRTPGTMSQAVYPDGSTAEGRLEFVRGLQTIKHTQEAGDLAGTVAFLASVDAAFITGQTIYVDAGVTRST